MKNLFLLALALIWATLITAQTEKPKPAEKPAVETTAEPVVEEMPVMMIDEQGSVPAPKLGPVPAEEKVYEMFDIQVMPSFPGGEQEMMKFIGQSLNYPPQARKNGIQGTVALTFIIGTDGSLSDVFIVKDIGGGCGQEARRMILTMPKWTPGQANGVPVRVRYTLPIRFRLG